MKHKIRLHLTHIHTPIRQMLSKISLRLIYRDQRPNPPISSFILHVLYLRLCLMYDDHLGHSLFFLLLDQTFFTELSQVFFAFLFLEHFLFLRQCHLVLLKRIEHGLSALFTATGAQWHFHEALVQFTASYLKDFCSSCPLMFFGLLSGNTIASHDLSIRLEKLLENSLMLFKERLINRVQRLHLQPNLLPRRRFLIIVFSILLHLVNHNLHLFFASK